MASSSSVLCLDGCGALGDPNHGYICADCRENRLLAEAAEAHAGNYSDMDDDEYSDNDSGDNDDPDAPLDPARLKFAAQQTESSVLRDRRMENMRFRQKTGLSILTSFLNRPREKDPTIIENEIKVFKKQCEMRRVAAAQLKRYMVDSSQTDKVVDRATWVKYQIGRPDLDLEVIQNPPSDNNKAERSKLGNVVAAISSSVKK